MKVLLMKGSTRKNGCTYMALSEAEKALNAKGVGRNMAWLLKCIAAGSSQGIEAPQTEEPIWTNFIR